MKIGVASTDGIVVNTHFGHSTRFLVYEVDEKERVSFEKEIMVEPVCRGGNHDEMQLARTVERLKGLDFVIVSRIGNGARAALWKEGIDAYELAMEIPEQQLIVGA